MQQVYKHRIVRACIAFTLHVYIYVVTLSDDIMHTHSYGQHIWLLTTIVKLPESEQLQNTLKDLKRSEVIILTAVCLGLRSHETFISAFPLPELLILQLMLV